MSLPRYPRYKETSWLEPAIVPEHWSVTKVKYLLRGAGSGGTPDTSKDEFWPDEGGVPWVAIADMSDRETVEHTKKRISEVAITAKKLEIWPAGTLIFSMYASLGHVAELKIEATINQALLALLPRSNVSQGYLKRWFEHLKPTLGQDATRNTQDNLSATRVLNLPGLLPPLSEQKAIAAFLDRETGKIDALVEEQRRLIELLKEKRQAVISHAVTKGLNPDAPMKPSGIEWLGDVPEHWEVGKLGYFAKLQGGYAFPSDSFATEGVAVVRMNNLARGRLDLSEVARIPESACIERVALFEGDLLWGMSGSIGETGSLGNFARVREEDLPCQLNQRVGRFLSTASVFNVNFLTLLIQSRYFYEQVLLWVTGTAQFNISSQQVESCIVAVPPMNEQSAIVQAVETELEAVDVLSAQCEEAISLLRQRRSALISAAVTGKIDVRAMAPAETEAA